MVHGKPVGVAVVRFTGSGLAAANHTLQTALLRAIAGAAGLAAVLALLTGLAVARRITRPVGKLIAATRAMGRGDRAARVGPIPAPGELRELATAFDQMADTLDRQEQLRRALVADVAHELRTPIAVLQAGHEALLDGVAEPTPDQLASLRDEVLRLARMVGDLQTLAAAEAAALQPDPEPLRPGRHRRHRRGQPGRPVRDHRDHPGTAARPGRGPRRPGQAAPGRHQPAHQRAEVHPGRRPRDHAHRAGRSGAVLEVTDTGVGIPADELPHIFDRFWRGRQAARVSGSGIGLSVAAELARAHGGHLAVSSQPGHGTEMTLTLPSA